MHSDPVTCIRCGRRLTATTSVAARMGSTCQRKAGAALATFTDTQIAKAVELIEDGAVVRARKGSPVFLAVSSDGASTYFVGPTGCTCPRGRRDATHGEPAHCYHRAARLVLAA